MSSPVIHSVQFKPAHFLANTLILASVTATITSKAHTLTVIPEIVFIFVQLAEIKTTNKKLYNVKRKSLIYLRHFD